MKRFTEITAGVLCWLAMATVVVWLWNAAKENGEAAAAERQRQLDAVRAAAMQDAWAAQQAEQRLFEKRRAEEWRHQEQELDRAIMLIEASRPIIPLR